MKKRKPLFLLSVTLCLFNLSLFGSSSKILGLNNPSLSETQAAQDSGLSGIVFPCDELGIGLSAVPDKIDIWKLPNRLVDATLFAQNEILLDYWNNVSGTGGMIFPLNKLGMAIGVFILRPNRNNWVTGGVRSLLPGFAADWNSQVGAANTIPNVPSTPVNIADLLWAMKLGNLSVGASAGWSYQQAFNTINRDTNLTDANRTQAFGSTQVLTLRLSGGLPLSNNNLIEAGIALYLGMYNAFYKNTLGPAAPQDDTISANNLTLNIYGRAVFQMLPDTDLVLMADFTTLPQNYSATDNGTDLNNTVIQKEPVDFLSFGVGSGINWNPSNTMLLNTTLSAVFGFSNYTSEPAVDTNKSPDSDQWISIRGGFCADIGVNDFLSLRGGVSASLNTLTRTVNDSAGNSDSTSSFTCVPRVSAGLGFYFNKNADFDMVLNVSNFASSPTIFQTLGISFSLSLRLP